MADDRTDAGHRRRCWGHLGKVDRSLSATKTVGVFDYENPEEAEINGLGCERMITAVALMSDTVFLLWHVHGDDEKLIGVYRTHADAEVAQIRLRDKPGFRDTPQGFEIHPYELGRDGWTEGFIGWAESLKTMKKRKRTKKAKR